MEMLLLMEGISCTSWYGEYPIIHGILYIPGGWEWDFWTINSPAPPAPHQSPGSTGVAPRRGSPSLGDLPWSTTQNLALWSRQEEQRWIRRGNCGKGVLWGCWEGSGWVGLGVGSVFFGRNTPPNWECKVLETREKGLGWRGSVLIGWFLWMFWFFC